MKSPHEKALKAIHAKKGKTDDSFKKSAERAMARAKFDLTQKQLHQN